MAWIESHQALQRHRKTIRAANLLNVSRPLLIGHLHCLWWWALDNADSDGRLGQVSAAEIAEAAEWSIRQAARFLDALVDAGFLDVDAEGSVSLHDWYDYAGKLCDRRTANAQRMRSARATRTISNEGRTQPARAHHVQRTFAARAPATGPDPTGPDRTIPPPGPDKQQEEGESDAAAPPAAEPSADLLDRVNQTLTGQPGWEPTLAQLIKLGQIADERGIDLELEALKIADYMRRPKRKDTQCTFRFVATWLEREPRNGSNGHGEHRQHPGRNGAGSRGAAAEAGASRAGEADPFAQYVIRDDPAGGDPGGP